VRSTFQLRLSAKRSTRSNGLVYGAKADIQNSSGDLTNRRYLYGQSEGANESQQWQP
jgi:hypothetical protein